jgi:ParB-like chromosome segregation protein Spo0J
LLAKVIAESGWRHPIVVSTRSGFVVMGHGRLEAATLMGCEQVPVDYQDFDSEQMELAAMVADNRLAELSELNRDALKDLLCDLDTGEMDLDLTGYDFEALEAILAPLNDPPTCPHCGGAL